MTEKTLDVRPMLAAGQEPFAAIMSAIEGLTSSGDVLCLFAPFEPAPLYRVLERQGFTHETTQQEDGSYAVRFTRR